LVLDEVIEIIALVRAPIGRCWQSADMLSNLMPPLVKTAPTFATICLSAGLLADSSQKPLGTGRLIDTPPMTVSDAVALVETAASTAAKTRRFRTASSDLSGTAGWIRTTDLLIHSQAL
jgi:hypothetical protein